MTASVIERDDERVLAAVRECCTSSYGLDDSNPHQGLWAQEEDVARNMRTGDLFSEPVYGRVLGWLRDLEADGLLVRHPSGAGAWRLA